MPHPFSDQQGRPASFIDQGIALRHTASRWLKYCLLALVCLGASIGAASEARAAELDWQIGIQNTCKIGCWTEVRIFGDLEPDTSYRAEARVLDADGNYIQFQGAAETSDEQGKWTTRVPVILNRINSDWQLTITKLPSGEQVWNQQLQPSDVKVIRQSQPWLVYTENVQGIETVIEFVSGVELTSISSLKELPENPLLIEGIDTLVSGLQAHTEADIAKLIAWVHTGGHSVVFPDMGAEEFLGSPIAKVLPATFDATAQIRDLSRMESFVGEASRLRTASAITIPRIVEFEGITLVGGLTGPLIVQSPWGLGSVSLCTLPLNSRAFQNWEALPQLFRMLAGFPHIEEQEREDDAKLLTQAGLSDMKTQWDAGLADFGMSAPSVWIPMTLLLLTALIVGPVDYFLVRHILKKPWLTWFTFPVLVILASWWGLQSDYRTNAEGDEAISNDAVLINEALVVDYDQKTGAGRYRQYVKALAPHTGRYNFQLQDAFPGKVDFYQELSATSSIPEETARGYYRPSSTFLDQTEYRINSRGGAITRAPIHEGSTVLIQKSGVMKPVAGQEMVVSDFESSATGQLKGEFVHQLDGELYDWVLAYNRLIYYVADDDELGTLKAGDKLTFPSRSINQREMTSFLTGTTSQVVKRKHGVGEDLLVRRLDYDPFSKDLNYIFLLTSFYDSVDGKEYLRLTNIEHDSWDVSSTLELGNAVLIGQLRASKPSVEMEDEVVVNQRAGFVRIVLPVKSRFQAMDRLPDYDEEKNNSNGS